MSNDQWNVGRLLRVSGSYWEACTLQTGIRLDVFSLIGEETLSGKDIAARLQGEMRGVTAFLNALTAMRLLVKREGKYANTTESKALLVKTSPHYIGYMIMHHHHMVPAWSELHKAVVTGKPVRKRSGDEEEIESFLMGMFNQAMAVAPHLAKGLDLSNRHRLLDLGGGPGTYAIHFCLSNPGLKADVFDLSTSRPFALKTIERFRLVDRIGFIPGNYLVDELKGSYDAVWLSHILHGLGPEECQMVIRKAVSVVEPGGVILVQEFILDDTLDCPLFPALFSLNMLVNTEKGKAYSEAELKGMLSKTGVKEISRLPFKSPNDAGIISGIV